MESAIIVKLTRVAENEQGEISALFLLHIFLNGDIFKSDNS